MFFIYNKQLLIFFFIFNFHVNKQFKYSRKSAPQFLLDVYKRLAEEENEGKSRGTRSVDDTDNLISDADEKAIDESDMIMTFQNKSK